jgi:hypothetical protein
METIDRSFSILLILIIAISGLIVVKMVSFGSAQSGTSESGRISADTTWTKAGSPYSLIGPVIVNQGVILTIEPGSTIDLNTYYLQVDGELRAIGTGSDKIYINGPKQATSAKINFTASSVGWNQGDGSGSIIQNCVANATSIDINGTSPRISDNFLSAYDVSSIIFSINTSPSITNNTLITAYAAEGIAVLSGAPNISGNFIHSAIGYDVWGISIVGDNNKALVYGNVISGYQAGIMIGAGKPTIQRNKIT